MTQRLYYDDSYTTDFIAQVIERTTVGDQHAVVLDRTYFYPTGGGQPNDSGIIHGVAVGDVVIRPDDHAILHVVGGEIAPDEVECRVGWPRRFDHMQQHTGQHILTRAFVEIAGAHTIGFHLGVDSTTIDLDRSQLAPAAIDQVEDLANQVLIENRPVTARVVSTEEFAALNARMLKMPSYLATDGLRVVEVEGFDITACGGTHVARSGEIGMIKILKIERLNDKESRVDFRCGGRALHDYRLRNTITNQLAADLTVGVWEIDQSVGRLKVDLKQTQRTLKAAEERLLEYECAQWLAQATSRDGVRIVKAVLEGRDAAQARALASRLTEEDGVIALCGVPGEKAQLILGRSAGVDHDMNQALKRGLAVLGTDRGGGRAEFAQGGGVAADAALVAAALDQAETALFA
jgi:alanyl-tRNA synthetase